jgi:hypothetical protein
LKIKTAEDKAARAEQKLIDLAVSHDKVMKEKAEEVCVCVGLPFAWVCLVSAPCLLYSYYVGCLILCWYLEYLE